MQNILPQAVGSVSPIAFVVVFVGGILTSVSPCILTMIPIIVGYIGGYGDVEGKSRLRGFTMSLVFVLGLSVTFAIFGVTAVLLGKVVGQLGQTWYYLLAAVAIIMGLQLLGVINLRFPVFDLRPSKNPGLIRTFLMGLMFGLVMSPCATPVLAVIITYVAASGSLFYGAGLLFAYGLGHGMPLILAGTFTASIKQLPRFRRFSHYITQVSGVVLMLLGLYFLILVRWS